MTISFKLPLRLVSEMNFKEHWTKKYRRAKYQKKAVSLMLNSNRKKILLPCKVVLTRVAPRKFDSDNLQAAFKSIRDEIASHLIPGLKPGRADDDGRIEWFYEQKKGETKEHSVLIDIHTELEDFSIQKPPVFTEDSFPLDVEIVCDQLYREHGRLPMCVLMRKLKMTSNEAAILAAVYNKFRRLKHNDI